MVVRSSFPCSRKYEANLGEKGVRVRLTLGTTWDATRGTSFGMVRVPHDLALGLVSRDHRSSFGPPAGCKLQLVLSDRICPSNNDRRSGWPRTLGVTVNQSGTSPCWTPGGARAQGSASLGKQGKNVCADTFLNLRAHEVCAAPDPWTRYVRAVVLVYLRSKVWLLLRDRSNPAALQTANWVLVPALFVEWPDRLGHGYLPDEQVNPWPGPSY